MRKFLWRAEIAAPVSGARIERLAQSIDALAEKDERFLNRTREIADMRLAAAAELHRICGEFVDRLNALLTRGMVSLDPAVFSSEAYNDDSLNLVQIHVRGRILQIQFRSTPELISTEDFRIPYILSGAVRAFNQALLDKDVIEEQLLFFTLEKGRPMWRFFDARTYRSGPFDGEYLTSLMEQLI
jgi:hypothetical protein